MQGHAHSYVVPKVSTIAMSASMCQVHMDAPGIWPVVAASLTEHVAARGLQPVSIQKHLQ